MRPVLSALAALALTFYLPGCSSTQTASGEASAQAAFVKIDKTLNPVTGGEIVRYPDAHFQLEMPVGYASSTSDIILANKSPPWLMATFSKHDRNNRRMGIDIWTWGKSKPRPRSSLPLEAFIDERAWEEQYGNDLMGETISWEGHAMELTTRKVPTGKPDDPKTEHAYVYEITFPFSPQAVTLQVSIPPGYTEDQASRFFYEILNTIDGQWDLQAPHDFD